MSPVIACATEMLRRSKSTPLEIGCVSLNLLTEPFKNLARAALSDIRRILELHIVFDDPASLMTLLEFSSAPVAPILEFLRLSMSSSRPSFTIPATVLWNAMPALHTLELRDTHISCNLPVLPHLSRLAIDSISTGSHDTNVSWLITFLKSTPNIQEIAINGLSSETPTDLMASSRVSLPKLSLLRLKSANLVGSAVFNWIDYPNSTRVEYKQRRLYETQSGDTFSNLQMACSRISTSTDVPLIHEITLSILKGCLTIEAHLTESAPHPHLKITLRYPTSLHVPNYTQLFAALPLSQTSTLSLQSFTNRMHNLSWKTLFSSCTQLTSLNLLNCGSHLVEGLLKAPGEQEPPVPELQTLRMRGCSFNVSPDERDDRMCNALLKFVDEHPKLDKLELGVCDVMRDVVVDIQYHIGVDWDEVEMEYHLSDKLSSESEIPDGFCHVFGFNDNND